MKLNLPLALGLTFSAYIFGLFSYHIIAPDKDFSELENRTLKSFPKFSKERFFEGTFGKEFETYIADQFPFRPEFISLKSHSELLLQKKENNGVYIGEDDYFMQHFTTPNLELTSKNASYISQFADVSGLNVYMLLSPTSTKIHEDKLPAYATPYDEKEYIEYFTSKLSENVSVVDLYSALNEHRNEYVYYKTDHHWTTLGAYYGYLAWSEAAGQEPLTLEDFEVVNASDSFYGTLFSKGNFTYAKPDTIQVFNSKTPNTLEVNYVSTNTVTNSLYEESYLDTKDKYSMFLDNNHPLITIKTSVKNGKTLMVLKDSYANCFVPFLTQHYEEIHVLDLRMMNMPILNYAKTNNIDDVIFLYNVQNFSVEAKFSLLVK